MTHRLHSRSSLLHRIGILCMLGTPLWGLLSGCGGIQSTLDPHGPQAEAIARIAWMMFYGAAAILTLVTALALYAFYRPERRRPTVNERWWIIAGGIAFPTITLSALLVYGIDAMGSIRTASVPPGERIEVIANQWWWEVRYYNEEGLVATTANEIHIPSGKPVTVTLRSRDVIHSFWVPNLLGKMDIIPARTNQVVLHASMAGTYRGQCAEYCGAQHARMAFHVIAQEPTAYIDWLEAQRRPARVPVDATAMLGQRLFKTHCIACHTVRGMGNAQHHGPDLTHVASRRFIAAGTLDNNRDNLLAFITDSQALKPGSGMPSHAHLEQQALYAIARYLEDLQ